MDVTKILNVLRGERERIEEAILSLERLVAGKGKRRGRPPTWLKNLRGKGSPALSRTERLLTVNIKPGSERPLKNPKRTKKGSTKKGAQSEGSGALPPAS
jgi:hypothetical protein